MAKAHPKNEDGMTGTPGTRKTPGEKRIGTLALGAPSVRRVPPGVLTATPVLEVPI